MTAAGQLQTRMEEVLGLKPTGKAKARAPPPKSVVIPVVGKETMQKLLKFKALWNATTDRTTDGSSDSGVWATRNVIKRSLRSTMHELLAKDLTKTSYSETIRTCLATLEPSLIDKYTDRFKPKKFQTPHADGRPWLWTVDFSGDAPLWFRMSWSRVAEEQESHCQDDGHLGSSPCAVVSKRCRG